MAAIKDKIYFGQQILSYINANRDRHRDEAIDIRQVIEKLDQYTNKAAKDDLIARMQFFDDHIVGEHFITTFAKQKMADFIGGSKLTLPSKYVNLPDLGGINGVFPESDKFLKIRKMRPNDIRRYANNMASQLDQDIGYYPEGNTLIFTNDEMKDVYGEDWTIRLVITDAEQIAENADYPIPPDLEQDMITEIGEWFLRPLKEIEQDTSTDMTDDR